MTDLTATLRDWHPAPTTDVDTIDAAPANAFAALLDLRLTFQTGQALPPAWHWFYFLSRPRRSELGADGHLAEGQFLPRIPDRRRMFAGGRLRWHAPIRIGDRLTRRSSVREVAIKRGKTTGQMAFVTVTQEIRRDDELLVSEEQDIVYRSQPAGQARAVTATAAEPPGDHEIDFPADPITLFQFSALTANAHRIHYDYRYTTEVEGYPGLVVHGPLMTLLSLEIPRRQDNSPDTFSYRLSRPAFADTRIVAGAQSDGDRTLTLWAGAAGTAPSISGVAEWQEGQR